MQMPFCSMFVVDPTIAEFYMGENARHQVVAKASLGDAEDSSFATDLHS